MSDPVLIKPAWVSPYPDSGDPTKFGPAAWNAPRVLDGGTPGQVAVRDPASPSGASWVTPSAGGAGGFVRLASQMNIVQMPAGPGTETTVWSVVLPPGQLATDGACWHVLAWGWNLAGGEGVFRDARLYLGADFLGAAGGSGGVEQWYLEVDIVRVNAGLQRTLARCFGSTAIHVVFHDYTNNFDAPIELRLTLRTLDVTPAPSIEVDGVELYQY